MFKELLDNRDEQLFNQVMNNTQHVLYSLLAPPSAASQHCQLRQRAHNRQLPQHTGRLTDCNFITRMLYRDSYWFHNFTLRLHLHLILYLTHNVLYFSSTYYYNLRSDKLLIKNMCVSIIWRASLCPAFTDRWQWNAVSSWRTSVTKWHSCLTGQRTAEPSVAARLWVPQPETLHSTDSLDWQRVQQRTHWHRCRHSWNTSVNNKQHAYCNKCIHMWICEVFW